MKVAKSGEGKLTKPPASEGLTVTADKVEKAGETHAKFKWTNANKPFVFWDGEAVQDGAGYCLLGNSRGGEICTPNLSTGDCLAFLLSERERIGPAFHVAFAFDYDVNNVLRELSWPHLIQLHQTGRTVWHGYHIKHNPHKSFSVKKDGVYIRIDDVFSYFRCRYDKALAKYGIGSPAAIEQISAGKDARPDFVFGDIDKSIRPYWQLEMSLGTQLMDRVRRDINAAGFYIGTWHGPGALAGYALSQHKMSRHMGTAPEEVNLAARTAFAGGWFERFKAGVHEGPVWTADINSAYAFALSRLPSLATGRWVYLSGDNEALRLHARTVRLGVFRLRFHHGFGAYMATSHGLPRPLWQRDTKGGVNRPTQSDGWYWNHEARLVAHSSHYEFVEAWVYEDDGTYPFEWIEDMFMHRLALQAANDPAEKGFKWALASAFGKTVQRAGWDRRKRLPPRWHQIEWGGSITSWCRAMIYTGALPVAASGGLISIDTDGIISTCPFVYTAPHPKAGSACLPRGEGNQLGRWKVEQYSGIIYIQNGVYWLRDMQGNWIAPKTRGLPAGSLNDPDIAIRALASDGIIRVSRHNFVGYGAAMHGRRDEWRTWTDSEYNINVHISGSRQHVRKICRACREGKSMVECLHDLALVPSVDKESSPHKLPWLEPDDQAAQNARLRHEILAEFM